jgi:Lrp/AsnC family leucine-responsive transcriptional regulator
MILPRPPELIQAEKELDETDLKILRAYQKDASLSFKDLGEITHLPVSTIFDHIKRLRRTGIIRNIVPLLNAGKLGLNTTEYIFVKQNKIADCCKVADEIAKLPEVHEVHEIAGAFDIFVKVKVRDNIDLHNILQRIQSIEGSGEAQSTIVMRTIKEEVRLKI